MYLLLLTVGCTEISYEKLHKCLDSYDYLTSLKFKNVIKFYVHISYVGDNKDYKVQNQVTCKCQLVGLKVETL